MIKKCSNCYWCQEKEFVHSLKTDNYESVRTVFHIGCYAGGKWRKWVSKMKIHLPNECQEWKEVPEVSL